MIFTTHLGIELTQRCNLNCKHCFRGESTNLDISREIIEKIFDEVKFVDVLDLSGGEVFLGYEQLKMVLEVAKERGVQISGCSMLTNGTIYDERIYKLLNEYFGDNYQVGISDDDFHDKSIRRIYGNKLEGNSSNPDLCPVSIKDVENNMRRHYFDEHCIGFQRVSMRLIENGRAMSVDSPRKKFEAEGYYYCKFSQNENIYFVGPMIFIGADGYISDINSDIAKREEQSIGNIKSGSLLNQILNGGIKIGDMTLDEFEDMMKKREMEFSTHQGDHLIFKDNKMAYTTYEPDFAFEKAINEVDALMKAFDEACDKGKMEEFLNNLDFSDYPHDISQIEHCSYDGGLIIPKLNKDNKKVEDFEYDEK